MTYQRIISTNQLSDTLNDLLKEKSYDQLFVLTDEHTAKLCYPLIAQYTCGAHHITIPAGDENKHIDTLCHVWKNLSYNNATRHSLMINLGGGMVTDLGGFAAATYKRGIRYINIPTTLLAMVDAYVDSQLFDFDMSPDLSMQIQPTLLREERSNYIGSSYGLQWSISF